MIVPKNNSLGQTDKGGRSQERNSRICMLTGRSYSKRVFQSGLYECEDVLSEIDDVDSIFLQAGTAFNLRERCHRRLVWHDITKKLVLLNPGFHSIKIEKEYDLFVVVCNTLTDLLYTSAVKGWKDRCRTSVCWITELYASSLPQCESWFPALEKFDHVVVAWNRSARALGDAIGRRCHYVPSAVDAIRFSPYPNPPLRAIDVYSMGRRLAEVHKALGDLSRRKEIFYIFDTFNVSDADTKDHRQHRQMFADIAKRSRYFIVGPSKTDVPEETHGQSEVGYRYYEGSAAGAVLLGQIPASEAFQSLFGWPGAVIEIQPDGSDIVKVLSDLAGEPERLANLSRRNAMEALLRHDWAYRWKEILEIAGLRPSSRFANRQEHLARLAEQAKCDGKV